jgi:PAS domain S-box-containing protein
MAIEYQPSKEELASVIVCDISGIVQTYAAGAATMFQWGPEEVVGRLSVAAFHDPDKVATIVPRLLQTAVEKGKFEEEVTLVRKDGSRFQGILTVRPKFKDGKQVGFMGFTRPL